MVEAFGISNQGLVRKGNEDGFICDPGVGLFAVADGMGGHSAGEVASRLALESVEEYVRRSPDGAQVAWPYGVDPQLSHRANRVRTAVQLANMRVLRASDSCDDYTGMGTTMTAALVADGRLSYGHVGDSRLYALDDTGFRQITRDDTWVATILANDPSIKAADLAHHPMRHVLTNVVGGRDQLDVQVGELAIAPGALFLLCSDGLHGMVADGVVEQILRAGGPLSALGARLIRAALDGGGHDNVTAVLVRQPDGQ
jgi:PPM family protein phosphatase